MIDLLKELLKPGNHMALAMVLAVATVLALVLMLLVVYAVKTWGLNFKVGPLSLTKGDDGDAAKTTGAQGVAESAGAKGRSGAAYRKILYIKVTCLSDKTSGGAPFYHRTVERLEASERSVPVYDEAVYYMLELFAEKKTLAARSDRSSGVVDSRMVIPWKDELVFRDANARLIKQIVQMEPNEDTDTLLTVSHFENGLQGENQDFATDVPEDAEYVRLIVDFSSVPEASRFILPKSASVVSADGREKLVALTPYGDAMFMLLSENAKKGDLLKMCFTFDWSRVAHPKQEAVARA